MNAATGAAVADDIRRGGGSARFFQADVSDSGDVRRMAEQVADALGRIDVLVNVAGIQGMVADAVELPEEEWHRVVDTNLTSIYLCSKYCIPHMLEAGGGSIVNVASVQSYFNMPGSSAYAAAKGGVVSLTRAMALDFARRSVRVKRGGAWLHRYAPAARVRKGDRDEQGTIDKWNNRMPIGRLQTPAEVAEVILFLASPRASAVTGTTYVVDGGMLTAQPTWEA